MAVCAENSNPHIVVMPAQVHIWHTPAASQNCSSSSRVMLSECPANECASGTAELGSCLTDATREGPLPACRRKFAATLAPERFASDYRGISDPVVTYKPPCLISQINIFKLGWRVSAVKIAKGPVIQTSRVSIYVPVARRRERATVLCEWPERHETQRSYDAMAGLGSPRAQVCWSATLGTGRNGAALSLQPT